MRRGTLMIMIVTFTLLPLAAIAGELDSPGTPIEEGSGMPTLEDMYEYLTAGALWTDPGSFQNPSAAPASTMKTLQEIYAKLKELFEASTARPDQVLDTVTLFNTEPLNWGVKEGTIPTQGNVTGPGGATTFPIPDGYYSGKKVTAKDANLIASNIKKGVTIFGVTGTTREILCPGRLSSGGRWCKVGNGTVIDMTTGLIWQQDASCWRDCTGIWIFGSCTEWTDRTFTWAEAMNAAAIHKSPSCGLSDGSSPGDWRLPTKDEFDELTHGSEAIRVNSPGPFYGIQSYYYWSGTSDSQDQAWGMSAYSGYWGVYNKELYDFYVWLVRDGQVSHYNY